MPNIPQTTHIHQRDVVNTNRQYYDKYLQVNLHSSTRTHKITVHSPLLDAQRQISGNEMFQNESTELMIIVVQLLNHARDRQYISYSIQIWDECESLHQPFHVDFVQQKRWNNPQTERSPQRYLTDNSRWNYAGHNKYWQVDLHSHMNTPHRPLPQCTKTSNERLQHMSMEPAVIMACRSQYKTMPNIRVTTKAPSLLGRNNEDRTLHTIWYTSTRVEMPNRSDIKSTHMSETNNSKTEWYMHHTQEDALSERTSQSQALQCKADHTQQWTSMRTS